MTVPGNTGVVQRVVEVQICSLQSPCKAIVTDVKGYECA